MRIANDLCDGRTILLVDHDELYLEAMQQLLEREGYRVLFATNEPAASKTLRENLVDLVILDYCMPGMTGEEAVSQLRQHDPYVQVILQTGYAGQRPQRDVLDRLNIQGYYDKGDGLDRFLLLVRMGVRAATTVRILNANHQALCYILQATPALQRIQPLGDLLQEVLERISELVGSPAVVGQALRPLGNTTVPRGFLAMLNEDGWLSIRAAIGERFAEQHLVDDYFSPEGLSRIRRALLQSEIDQNGDSTVVPLRARGVALGAIYLERVQQPALDSEFVQVYANQAATAIQNIQLYEMATLDPLTGVYARRFFDQWLSREIRTAFRSRQALALLVVDLDGLKLINEAAGYAAGDLAMGTVGNILRHAIRPSDVVGRVGGDEFAIILPQTASGGGESIGQRILELLRSKNVFAPGGAIALAGSLGLAALPPHEFVLNDMPPPADSYFQRTAQMLVARAEEALDQARREGGNRLCVNPRGGWEPRVQSVSGAAGDNARGYWPELDRRQPEAVSVQ